MPLQNNIVVLLEGASVPDFLAPLIRQYLDGLANGWEANATRYAPILDAAAESDTAAVIAYIRNPANVNYTIPAYTPIV